MATTTTNYGLTKPAATEYYDIEIQNSNMDKIDTQMKQNADNMLKKDGSVQMTGVLKTVGGGTVGLPANQIVMGQNIIMIRDGNVMYFAVNCYHDGVNWKYKENGKASLLIINVDMEYPILNTAISGTKDAVISWITNNVLTHLTGLPLTGGTLSGYLEVKSPSNTNVVLTNTTRQRGSLVRMADDDTLLFANYSLIGVAGRCMTLGNENTEISSLLKLSIYGSGTAWKVYGEHNITCSTSAPSSALTEGAQHQVY
ncbi:hypothetical protein [Aminipila terrae]|uniref:Uncharacterized protein n=1 Tax=Aminipila terrae TaxID=2697030 RepID=A0A6P1MPI5_9FIRM|nr:hypothetical protein [Aminipila terrae]QHI72905.1 hypothetical protein Ami3637_11265 [Aminipila terrae]